MPVHEALAACALDRFNRALAVSQLAGVVAEIEFAAVPRQMGFAHVVIGADHAALEDRKEVFDRVAVLEATSGDLLAGAVVDAAMAVKFAPYAGVNRAFVGHQMSRAVNVGHDQGGAGFWH